MGAPALRRPAVARPQLGDAAPSRRTGSRLANLARFGLPDTCARIVAGCACSLGTWITGSAGRISAGQRGGSWSSSSRRLLCFRRQALLNGIALWCTTSARRAGRRSSGTAVLAPGLPIEAVTSVQVTGKTFQLQGTYPGSLAIATVDVPGFGVVTCVSIYGFLDQGWAITSMHHLLSDVAPLLHARRNDLLVMGGDLNASTQLSRPWRYYHRNLFERIELFGMVDLLGATAPDRPALRDCPCEDEPCGHVQAHQHPRSQVPWHNDYLYATQKLAERLIRCEVVEAGHPPWSLSDHRPVVADFA
jgi:endonuclease/exonuclease/phosphatase family metal-dependent hydrolase